MSYYLENALLNAILRASTYTSPSDIFVALYTSNPNDDGSGAEVSGGSYARKQATFAAPVGGVATTNADVAFDQASATWGTITHAALYDAVTGGNLLFHTALDIDKLVETGDIFTIRTGQLTVTLD